MPGLAEGCLASHFLEDAQLTKNKNIAVCVEKGQLRLGEKFQSPW